MSVAKWEREIIRERTVEALAEVRESGVRLGRPITIPAPVIARVRRLRIKGATLKAIGEQLKVDEVPRRMAVRGGTAPLSGAS